MKALLLTLSICSFICCAAQQRQYGIEDTSYKRRTEYNLSKDALRVFPNPVVNDLYITVKQSDIRIRAVFVYDRNGNRVFEQTVSANLSTPVKLRLADLDAGMYYLVVETNRQPYRMQLVKH